MSVDASWELTRAISPRSTVRVAAVDAYGAAQNIYTRWQRVRSPLPDAPWAVNLAGSDGMYRLVGFDLDAKSGPAAEDAGRLQAMLSKVGIEHVVCESGPSNGRHVWVALSEPVGADIVADLARLAKHVFPSLDIAPLTNARTGCLRPPGAPHRFGGASQVISGDLEALRQARTSHQALNELVRELTSVVGTAREHSDAHTGPVHTDAHGRPYIPGPKRNLPAFSASALAEPAELGDASTVLWRFLIGAAGARWHYDDVAAAAATSPGLEHARTVRDRGSRLARPARGPASAQAVLARQWAKAVQHVASRPKGTGDDPTFDPRAAAIADMVQDVQDRARAVGGRWHHRGGPADRRILDALSVLSLKAMSVTVEADTRRLALMAGVGRETARTALLRLAADGWITRTRDAEGPRGAHWSIQPREDIHSSPASSRSQADPRPPGAGAAKRLALLQVISTRLQNSAHDVFTLSPGLGHHAGNVFAQLSPTAPADVIDLSHDLGLDSATLLQCLGRLSRAGLVQDDGRGRWRAHSRSVLDRQAQLWSVDGRLDERAKRYDLERELWAWWQAEQVWMQAPRRTDDRSRPRPGQLSLLPMADTNIFGAHPRRSDGRADFRRARVILADDSPIGARPIDQSPATQRRPRLRVA